MCSQIKEMITSELFKLLKNKVNYIYIVVTLVAIIASSFGMKLIENTDNLNTGYSFILFSLQTLFTTIIPIMLLLFAASTISSEKNPRTIRNILATGCSKNQFVISKVIASLIFLLVIMATAAIAAIFIGYIAFGFGNISEDGFVIMTHYQFWAKFLISYAILTISLFAVISFGIMISTIAQNNISAITTVIGTYIVLEGIKTKVHIENFVFSSYIEFPLNLVSELTEGLHASWTPKLYYYLIISALWIIISLSTSFLVIKKLEFK